MRSALLVALAAATTALVLVVSGSGPFRSDALRNVGLTARPGGYIHSAVEIEPAITVFGGMDLRNTASVPVELLEVVVIDADESIEVIGSVALRYEENDGAGVAAICAPRLPPPGHRTHPLKGTVIAPGGTVQVLLGVDAPVKVGGEIRRVRVDYRIRGRATSQSFPHLLRMRPERGSVSCAG